MWLILILTQRDCLARPPTASSFGGSKSVGDATPPPTLGVSDADVEDLVRQVIRDPNINIAAIPDGLETQIYRSTIKIVLHSLYGVLNQIQGARIGNTNHELQLKRISASGAVNRRRQTLKDQYTSASTISTNVRDDVLENIADGLLSNHDINQRFLPDAIEKKLYINCLKLIFRLIEMITSCIKVTVCGHDIQVVVSRAAVELAMEHATVRLVEVDRSKLFEMAQSVDSLDLPPRKKWWFSRKKAEFLQTLHASLVALILAIIDDLMHRTCIELLSDRLVLDIVPSSSMPEVDSTTSLEKAAVPEEGHHRPQKKTKVGKATKLLAVFLLGMSTGIMYSERK